MFDLVVSIIADYQGIPGGRIRPDSRLVNDLGLSSFDVVSLVGRFEDAFDVEVPDRQIKTMQTVNDVVLLLQALTSGQ
ncbi:MAG: acyl carrier protein [Oscillospiraceae bacterium]|nr:acyl carrier protein [Oscillospiraceae bacterium]